MVNFNPFALGEVKRARAKGKGKASERSMQENKNNKKRERVNNMTPEKIVDRARVLLSEFKELNEEIEMYKGSVNYDEKKKKIAELVNAAVSGEETFSQDKKKELKNLMKKQEKLNRELKTTAKKGERNNLVELKKELQELEIDILILENQSEFRADDLDLFVKAEERKSVLAIIQDERAEKERHKNSQSEFQTIFVELGALLNELDRKHANRAMRSALGTDIKNESHLINPLGLDGLMSERTNEFYKRSHDVMGMSRNDKGTQQVVHQWLQSNEDISLEEYAARSMKADADFEKEQLLEKGDYKVSKLAEIDYFTA